MCEWCHWEYPLINKCQGWVVCLPALIVSGWSKLENTTCWCMKKTSWENVNGIHWKQDREPSFPKAINVDKSKFWQEISKDQVDQTKNGLSSSLYIYTRREYCSAQSFDILLLLQI